MIFIVDELQIMQPLLADKEITSTLVRTNMHSKITVSCCDASKWKVIIRETPQVEIEFIDPFLPSSNPFLFFLSNQFNHEMIS